MHDFVSFSSEYIFYPPLNKTFIKIATPAVSNRIVSAPTVNSHSITNNEAVVAGPSRPKRFHMWVTSFEVNCNLLGGG
jgi:hypothetical protein